MNEVDVKEEDDVLLWQEEEDHESWWAQQDDDAMEEGDAWMLESAEEFMAMLSKEEQDDHRALQYASSYKTPRWWGRYKRMIGRPYLRRCKKWVEDQDHPPTSGSCPRRHGNYTCFFGNQACLENGKKKPFPHPNQQCTCVDRVWECQPWECPTPQFYKCPLKSPLDSPQYPQGSMRCLGDMECTYGEETCCGKTHPSLVVSKHPQQEKQPCVCVWFLLPQCTLINLLTNPSFSSSSANVPMEVSSAVTRMPASDPWACAKDPLPRFPRFPLL